MEKLLSIPGSVQHQIETVISQPSSQGSVLVVVTGKILTEGGMPMHFNEMFLLFPSQGSFFILNEIFNLNLDA